MNSEFEIYFFLFQMYILPKKLELNEYSTKLMKFFTNVTGCVGPCRHPNNFINTS